MLTFLFSYAAWGVFILRVVFGVLFVAHGSSKLAKLKQTQAWFQSIGFAPGAFWGTLVGLVETFGGLAMILGLLTQVAAVLIGAVMLVATVWKMRQGQKFVGGYELDLTLLAIAIAFATNGSGSYGLDVVWQTPVLF